MANDISKIIVYNDSLPTADKSIRIPSMEDFVDRHKGPKTRITVLDEFGDILMDYESNLVVIGGAIFTLEKLFNVRSALNIDSINNICQIPPMSQIIDNDPHPQSRCVCLWGIGIDGCGDAFGSVRDVKYYEREIGQNGRTTTGMIPFRVVTSEFDDDNKDKYFLMKEVSSGHYGYYAKTFDDTPFIRSLWKDGAEGEDGTEVTDNVHNTTRTEDIETFVEMHMTIDKTDIREYFDLNGEIEQARVNTIGLFIATPVYENNELVGYKDVTLFSKFNMNNEPLASKKSVLIRYRIYAS